MKFESDPATRHRAKWPHNLFMLNLAVFHLLMTPAAIALDVGLWGLLLPLGLSLAVILHTWLHARRMTPQGFEFLHWQLALLRYRYLLVAYGITAILIGLGMLLSHTTPDVHMQQILQTVFLRIAVMPVLIIVMVCFYLESTALSQAGSGEIPDSIVRSHAPTQA